MKEIEYSENKIIKQIKEYLLEAEQEVELHSPEDSFPYLKVKRKHGTGQTLFLTITVTEQPIVLSDEKQSEKKKKEPAFVNIIFEVVLPCKIAVDAMWDMASLLFFLNRQSNFPGYELIEYEKRIAFRYVLIHALKEVSKELIQGITGMILMTVEGQLRLIEKISHRELTFEEFIEEAVLFHEYNET